MDFILLAFIIYHQQGVAFIFNFIHICSIIKGTDNFFPTHDFVFHIPIQFSQKKEIPSFCFLFDNYNFRNRIVFLKGEDSLNSFTYDSHELWSGFTTIASQFRFDGLFIISLLPLTIGLFILSRKGFKLVDAIMVLILGMLLLAPIISGFTTYTNAPYRFIPLIIFIAIGVGVLFSKRVS